MNLRSLFKRRPKTTPWVDRLDSAKRRTLIRNLRQLVESKAELERRLSENARPR